MRLIGKNMVDQPLKIKLIRKFITGIFYVGLIIILGAFSMFNSKHKPSKELYEVLQSAELVTKYSEMQGFNLKDLDIEKARIKGAKIQNFSISNTDLKNFDARSSHWENGKFTEVNFNDIYFDEIILNNVVFEKSNLKNVNFISGKLKNVKFIDCTITKSAFYYLEESDIEFINTKIHDNEYKFSDSQIQMRLINSEFRDTDMMSLKEGSSIYMENSEINTVNFQYSKMDSFKSVNSKMLNSTLGDSEIKELNFDKTHIDISFGKAVIDKVLITNSKIDNLGSIWAKVKQFEISNCTDPADVSFGQSEIVEIKINNCNFKELYPSRISTKSLLIENAIIEKSSFYKSNIDDFILRNVTFNGKTKFKKFQAGKSTLENIKIGPNAEMLMDGANIEF